MAVSCLRTGSQVVRTRNLEMDNEARARLAATVLVEAAGTDCLGAMGPKIVSWFGRGRPARKIERRLTATRKFMLMAAAHGARQDIQAAREVAQMRAAETREWSKRLADVLAAHPDAAGELDLLVEAIRACLPESASADDTGGFG
jgi:hypothetical protein